MFQRVVTASTGVLCSTSNIHVILHVLLHSCVPDREAGGSPGIDSAVCPVSPSAVAPSPSSAPPPAAPAHAAASAQPLGGSAERCTAAAPAPGGQCKNIHAHSVSK